MPEDNERSVTLPVIVFASFRPKSGERSIVQKILQGMVAPTRSEPGNLVYDLYENSQDSSEERPFHLFEKYKDSEALEAHRATAHYKEYRASIGEHLSEPISVQVLGAIDAKV